MVKNLNPKAQIEAALFISDGPLALEKLSKIAGIGLEETKQMISLMQTEMAKDDRGIELVGTPEGYEFRIKEPYRIKIVKLAPLADLSDGMKRTLGIIVFKQPIKQSIIVKYQGNKAYGYIDNLEKKGLINTEKCGRTKLCTTTPDFEKYFGKTPEEVRDGLKAKMDGRKAMKKDN